MKPQPPKPNAVAVPITSVSTPTALGLSLAAHLAIFAALWTLSQPGKLPFGGSTSGTTSVDAEKAQAAKAGGTAPVEVTTFRGVPYSVYAKKTGKDILTQGRAAKLMNALQGLSLGSGKGGQAGLKSALDTSATGLLAAATSGSADTLTKTASKARFTFQATTQATAGNGARKMTDRERAELKRRFQALEVEFRKAYAAALNQDPQLEVTVSFEAEVRPTGNLQVVAFKGVGKHTPESLELLKAKMTELISQVVVAKDLAGTLIRGESVFVR